MPDVTESDYLKYRGKCREMSEALVAADHTLTLVRGFYLCPVWGEQQHWWVKTSDGTIIDPTKDQFPSKGNAEYVEFDGTINCANCNKQMKECDENAIFHGSYAFCSMQCNAHFVGVDI